MLIAIDVPHNKIQSAFISCFEGGFSPWLATSGPLGPALLFSTTPRQRDVVWWGSTNMFAGDYVFDVHFDLEGDADEGAFRGGRAIWASDVKEGLEIMAAKYPKHFAAMIAGQGDAITGDVFVQCVIFGKVIYG